MCKLDLEKIYDSIDWDLFSLRDETYGFWYKMAQMDHGMCLNHSLLINRTLEGFFQAQRCLRQGDPLFPFLFLLNCEALSCIVHIVDRANLIRGFKVAADAQVNHFQFTENKLIFVPQIEIRLSVKAIPFCFEAVSG